MTSPVDAVVQYLGLQGPPGPVGANVSSLSGLASLPLNSASSLGGMLVGYTPSAGGPTTYYQWAPASTATPNGSTIVAGNGGNWLLVTAVTTSVATRAALSAFADVLLLDGAQAFNQEAGYRAKWTLDKTSTLSADGVTVVAAASGVGKWVLNSRYSGRVPVTECGAVGDGVRVSDASIGASSTTLTSASLVAGLGGKHIKVLGAGAGGGDLVTTIVSSSTGSATLTAAASTGVTNAVATWATDDGPAINLAITACAACGAELYIPGSGGERIYGVATQISLSGVTAGLVVWQSPDATLHGFLSPGIGHSGDMILGQWTAGAYVDTISASGFGATTVTTTSATSALDGQLVHIESNPPGNTEYSFIRKVLSVAAHVMTLDEPLPLPFASGSVITQVTSRPTGIKWHGGVWTGNGARTWEMLGAIDCDVYDVTIDQRGGGYASPVEDPICSWDESCRNCWTHGGRADYPSNIRGWGTESSEHCGLRCVTHANCGFAVYDAIDFTLDHCKAYGANTANLATNAGLLVHTNGAAWSVGTTILGGSYNLNTPNGVNGIYFGNSIDTEGVNVDLSNAPSMAVQTTSSVSGLKLSGSVAYNGGGSGTGAINIASGSLGVEVDVDVTGCPIGFIANDNICGRIFGTVQSGGKAGKVSGGANSNLRLDLTALPGCQVVYVNGSNATRCKLSGHIKLPQNGTANEVVVFLDQNAILSVDNLTIDGAGGPSGWVAFTTTAGSTLRLGQNVDTFTSNDLGAVAGYCSKSIGSAAPNYAPAANGGTGVTVPWPDLKSADRVFLSLVAKGGTPSAMPQVTYTPGVSFTLTSYAGDTSTYHYEVR